MSWILIRASGLVAYGLLSASMVWGLLLSAGLARRASSDKRMTYAHESLSIAALVATGFHVVLTRYDEYLAFDWAEVLIPGRSDWRAVAMAFGILAFYGAVVITASFYLRQRIGQKAWRMLHFAAFGAWLAALVHGLAAGTDTGEPWGVALYAGSGLAVVGLVILRAAMAGNEDRPRRPVDREAVGSVSGRPG